MGVVFFFECEIYNRLAYSELVTGLQRIVMSMFHFGNSDTFLWLSSFIAVFACVATNCLIRSTEDVY